MRDLGKVRHFFITTQDPISERSQHCMWSTYCGELNFPNSSFRDQIGYAAIGARWSDQNFCRNTQRVVQTPDHVDRQPTTAVKHLGNSGPSAENALQILAREALLLHPEFD